MSVPEPMRHKGRLEVHVKAQQLVLYTMKILSNKNTFSEDIDSEIIRRMKDCVIDIYSKGWCANKFHANRHPLEHATRYRLQCEAISLCDEMLSYIGIAKHLYHLRSKRVKYWSERVIEVQALLTAWKESDVKRYGLPQH